MFGSWPDIAIVGVILLTVILGLIKGFVRQAIGIVAAVAGLLLAAHNYHAAAVPFKGIFSSETGANLIGFLLIFFGCLLLGWLIGWLVSKLMKGPLAFIDHAIGGVFGLLKGILICGILVFGFLVFPVDEKALETSVLAPYCFTVTKALVIVIPNELKIKFRVAYQEILGRRGSHGKKI